MFYYPETQAFGWLQWYKQGLENSQNFDYIRKTQIIH